jgi:hypothetical protein
MTFMSYTITDLAAFSVEGPYATRLVITAL